MYLILITVLSKQNYIKCEKQQFIKLGKCQNIISNSNIDRIIGKLHQIGNINIVTHQLNHKYYRAMDIIKDRVHYSAEYTWSSNCADSSYVKFYWNGEALFGQIKYFLEIQFNENFKYNFAYISPLTWNGNRKLHKVVDINRLVTDKVESEERLLIKLEDLIEIIGLFPLKNRIMNVEAHAIVSFSL